MITDIFIGGMLAVFRAVMLLVPEWGIDTEAFGVMGQSIGGHLGLMGGYFPVLTLAFVVGFLWTYRLVLLWWSFLRDMWDALPFT